MGHIEEYLDAFNDAVFFNVMDLVSGYCQVVMSPEDSEKTAYNTHLELSEWTVMPFGLFNAPTIFMRLMEQILVGIVWSKYIIYLDDVVPFGRTFQDTLMNLLAVLKRCQL